MHSFLTVLRAAVTVVWFVWLLSPVHAQTPPAGTNGAGAGDVRSAPQGPVGTPVQPTEVQSLKLKVAQRDAIIAQQASQSLHQQAAAADRQASDALKELQRVAETVKAENKWGEDVVFEPNQLTFTKAPEKMGAKPKPAPDPTQLTPKP